MLFGECTCSYFYTWFRDLRDIGCFINVIDGCKGIDKGTTLFGLSESIRSGVVFSTYSTLVSNVCTGKSLFSYSVVITCTLQFLLFSSLVCMLKEPQKV